MASDWEILGTHGWRLDAREDIPRAAVDDAGMCWMVFGESRILLTKQQVKVICEKFTNLLGLATSEEMKLERMRKDSSFSIPVGDLAPLLERIKALPE